MCCASIRNAEEHLAFYCARARISLPQRQRAKELQKMQRYNTLRSLDGLRVGFTLTDSIMSDVQLCARQVVDDNINACLRATNTSVFTRLASFVYQGINITLVPVNGSDLGVWREGMLSTRRS